MAAFREEERNAEALDWVILRDGGIALYLRREYLKEDLAWFAERGYKIISFACERWDSLPTKDAHSFQWNCERAMHEELAEKLGFPSYYGKNGNALNDCIREDLIVPDAGGLVLVFENFEVYCKRLDDGDPSHDYPRGLLDIFARAVRFHSLLGRRLVVLVQTADPIYAADGLATVGARWNWRERSYQDRGLGSGPE